jgi:hypothetical protein
MQSTQHRFRIGDRVRVRTDGPTTNPRTPAYIKASSGVVARLHGTMLNPLDHHGVYAPLCSVEFEVGDVFGTASRDRLSVDLHEDWLEPG